MHFDWIRIIGELSDFKYLLLFPVAILEGPIITVIAGFLASIGQLNFIAAYLVLVVGDLAGDSLYYCLGRWGGNTFIKRWGHYIGITSERTLAIESHFVRHGGKTLITGKITHGIGAVFLVAAGLVKMPFWKFFWYNLIATIPKTLILMLAGFYYGHALTKIKSTFEFLASLFIGVALTFLIIYSFSKRKNKK